MRQFSHLDAKGKARMVDVSGKPETLRDAVAKGSIQMKKETLRAIRDRKVPKGDVLTVAKIAGIMAAKEVPHLIPLCHSLLLSDVDLAFQVNLKASRIEIESQVRTVGRTGAEMEALTAVAVSALAIYDMCKAVDKEMTIGEIRLISKRGGRSGTYQRTP
jgi:cyclic pyranopterin monophosphate synthase